MPSFRSTSQPDGGRSPSRTFRAALVLLALASLAAAIAMSWGGGAAGSVRGERGRPLRATGAALDVHTHVASQWLTSWFDTLGGGSGNVPAVGADDLVAKLDEANVARAIMLSGGYFGAGAGITDDRNMAAENDFVSTEAARYPDRLIGFCGINPLFTSAVDEIDRCLALPGMVGVKLHFDASGVDLGDDSDVAAVTAVFDSVAEHDVPVLIHVAGATGGPPNVEELAVLGAILGEHPTVRVAFAHCGIDFDIDGIEYLLQAPNSGYDPERSFVDVSACLAFYRDAPMAEKEVIVWRFHKWGIDHVLFGSDYFAYKGETPAETLDILTDYPFTQSELNTILSNDGSAWLDGTR